MSPSVQPHPYCPHRVVTSHQTFGAHVQPTPSGGSDGPNCCFCLFKSNKAVKATWMMNIHQRLWNMIIFNKSFLVAFGIKVALYWIQSISMILIQIVSTLFSTWRWLSWLLTVSSANRMNMANNSNSADSSKEVYQRVAVSFPNNG